MIRLKELAPLGELQYKTQIFPRDCVSVLKQNERYFYMYLFIQIYNWRLNI